MERNSLSFVSRYLTRAATTKSVLCVGLDPTPAHVPLQLRTENVLKDIEDYLKIVINLAVSRVPVVKPQYAYYGALGPQGIQVLIELVRYAHERGLLVILDAKRADIGETVERYGEEVFGQYGVDSCTYVPYLGPTFFPAWKKWFKQGRMAIPMIRTSNPEAALLQDCKLENGMLVYEQMALWVKMWQDEISDKTDGAGNVGGVVGATWPEQAPRCRELAGDEVFFLIPGYGAQGGGSAGAVAGLPNSRGELMGTGNSSRAITLTSWWDKETKTSRKGDPLELIAAAIDASNADLNAALMRKLGKVSLEEVYRSTVN